MLRKGDEAIQWLVDYFTHKNVFEGTSYMITTHIYGKDVPSNSVLVEGMGFRLGFCPSWTGPQIQCVLTIETWSILEDIFDSIELKESLPL